MRSFAFKMTIINRYDLENSLRCRRLGYLTRKYEPRRYRVPQETRRRIERAITEVIADSDTSLIHRACHRYEEDVEARGIETSSPEENAYETFCRERNAMFALLTAASKGRCFGTGAFQGTTNRPPFDLLVNDANGDRIAYQPSPHLIIRQGEQHVLAVYRVVSRLSDDDQRYAYQDLSIYADVKATEQATGIEISKVGVCFIVMGRKADGYHDNPFTRRWRSRSTGQLAWSQTYTDPAGKSKRLGKLWEKQVLTPDEIEEWVAMLDEHPDIQSNVGDPWAQTFPEPIFYDAHDDKWLHVVEIAQNHGLPFNWRACRFPDRCPMHGVCWEGEDLETSSKYMRRV